MTRRDRVRSDVAAILTLLSVLLAFGSKLDHMLDTAAVLNHFNCFIFQEVPLLLGVSFLLVSLHVGT